MPINYRYPKTVNSQEVNNNYVIKNLSMAKNFVPFSAERIIYFFSAQKIPTHSVPKKNLIIQCPKKYLIIQCPITIKVPKKIFNHSVPKIYLVPKKYLLIQCPKIIGH